VEGQHCLAEGQVREETVLTPIGPDQGRAFHHLAKHPSSSSSHWIQAGAFTSFEEYRFAVRGRLNLLPTRTVAKRAGKSQLR